MFCRSNRFQQWPLIFCFAACSRVFSGTNQPTVRQNCVNVDWVDGDFKSKLANGIEGFCGAILMSNNRYCLPPPGNPSHGRFD